MVVAIAGVGVILTQGYLPWQVGVTGWVLVTSAVVALTIGGPGRRGAPDPVPVPSPMARGADPDHRLVQ
jgi:hypothetical protein